MNPNAKILFLVLFSLSKMVSAQETTTTCKVSFQNLAGSYKGECKNGLAHGKGEAIGMHKYEGSFKNGSPDGKGIYHFNEGHYFTGNFQDGIREGKGEEHFLRAGQPDSIVKGFWSGDVYRGKKYKTYHFNSSQTFDINDIIPTEGAGKMLTIEISTTSGAPNGTPTSMNGSSGFVLTINELVATDGSMIRKISGFETASKASVTYELSTFPVNLFATLSNGQTIHLDLYKSANWMVRLYMNK
jgi:hypothetical protein